MRCGVGRRPGLDLALLWLWCRLAATALIRPLAWEPLYARGAALENQKDKTNKQTNKKPKGKGMLQKESEVFTNAAAEAKTARVPMSLCHSLKLQAPGVPLKQQSPSFIPAPRCTRTEQRRIWPKDSTTGDGQGPSRLHKPEHPKGRCGCQTDDKCPKQGPLSHYPCLISHRDLGPEKPSTY